jgi:hypothetical protein
VQRAKQSILPTMHIFVCLKENDALTFFNGPGPRKFLHAPGGQRGRARVLQSICH